MSSSVWTCSSCSREIAQGFCLCGARPEPFCEHCFQPHISKDPGIDHLRLPIDSIDQFNEPKFFERRRSRRLGLSKLQMWAQRSYEAIEKAREQLNHEVSRIMQEVQRYAQSIEAQLQQARAYIECAVTEIRDTIYTESPAFSTPLASDLHMLLTSSYPERPYYSFVCDSSAILASFQSLFAVDIYNFEAQRTVICDGKGREWKVYRPVPNTVESFNIQAECTDGTVICYVKQDLWAAVGGYPSSTNAFFVQLSTHAVDFSIMKVARNVPGVVSVNGTLYAFGGYEGKHLLNSCEKWTETSGNWQSLRDMSRGRATFVPCRYQQSVYLLDMCQAEESIERFDVQSESFTLLPLQIQMGKLRSYVSAVVDSEMVLFGPEGQMIAIDLAASQLQKTLAMYSGTASSFLNKCQPIVLDRKIYYINYEQHKLMEFDCAKKVLSTVR